MTIPSHSIQRATITLALLVLLSKVIGFGREMIIAYRFGTGPDYDLYLIAVSIPIALYTLFGYAFTNLFLPDYGRAMAQKDRTPGLASLWRNFNISLASAVLLVIALILAAPIIIRLIAPGLDPSRLAEAAVLTRISAIIIIFGLGEAFFRSVAHAEKQFIIPALGPICANLVMIASIVTLSGRLSTYAILYGLVFGYLVQALVVLIPFLRSGVQKFYESRLIHRGTGAFTALALVIIIIEGSWQVIAIVDRYFASSMESGIVSALGYAYLLIMLPINIFAYALSTVIFPHFTDAFAAGDAERSGYLITRGICVSLLLSAFLTIIIWTCSDDLVTLTLKRGAFNRQSVIHTAELLRWFSLGLAGQFLIWTLSRAYYGARKYRVLGLQVAVVLGAKIISAALTVGWLGYTGLAISSTVAYLLGAGLLVISVPSLAARVDWRAIFGYFAKLCVISACAYMAARYINGLLTGQPSGWLRLSLNLTLLIGVVMALFLIGGNIMNISDIRHLTAIPFKRKETDVIRN